MSKTIAKKAAVQKIPTRAEVAVADTWDLTSLYSGDSAWEKDFKKFDKEYKGYADFRGKLANSAETIAECLKFDTKLDILAERLGTYAFLKTTEDQSNSDYQALAARFRNLSSQAAQLASFIRPELLAVPKAKMDQFLKADCLKDYKLVLQRIVRYRDHTLSHREEELLAMQSEMAGTANQVFRQLNDADLKFGTVKNEEGQSIELSNATLTSLLQSPKRSVRKTAFHQYYAVHEAHENTLAATLAGSVHGDVYYAKARNYPSALHAALFPDNVPISLYDNLIATVRKHLPLVHDYFDMRRRKMKLSSIHHYDTYVPILADRRQHHSWKEAVNLVLASLEPLGSEYGKTLEKGLHGRWCDRYPNQGKQSGAFSCGSFKADPFIMMNYKPDVLNDVFTLTHEAGHSMHSFYSAKNQPFMYYNYTIFVAEVASTFNEQLLAHHMMKRTKKREELAALINHEVDSIRATIVRQTMFAEFEKRIHAMAEAGEALTVAAFKAVYRELLEAYFGPNFQLDDHLTLEGFRIPHFYRAFYVYKYATGLSAAIALSRRVLDGGKQELKDYLGFLQGGCSKDPLDLLKDAGVDMTKPEPIETALTHFGSLVEQLDELIS
jgi:oligoendopeptidase F